MVPAAQPARNDSPISAQPASYDVTILGAGPAGLCAALRLCELGWRVALVENAVFPRPQIGESLSPGIFSLFDYLGMGNLLADDYYLRELPSRVIWEDAHSTGDLVAKNGFLVDRGRLDAALLAEAIRRGVDFNPAANHQSVDFNPAANDQSVDFNPAANPGGLPAQVPRARIVLDCRGRRGVRAADRVMTAPASLALWVQVTGSVMPRESRVEALPAGWLWGAPLPGGEYRVMAFVDPGLVKARGAQTVLQRLVAESRLFNPAAPALANERPQACPVFHYVHREPWRDDYIRVGEAAFTIDPLSSSGVEKAMRHALQTVIAVNTLLRSGDGNGKGGDGIGKDGNGGNGDAALARRFYFEKLGRSVADHRDWTCGYYSRAWPGPQYPFWRDRSADAKQQPPASQAPIDVKKILHHVWEQAPHLSHELHYEQACCVVGDLLELRPSLRHPRLKDELVYLGGVELKPLLDLVPATATYGELLYRWSLSVPVDQAGKMLAFLCANEVLC
jgi:flavin-dependent dehydrogenase